MGKVIRVNQQPEAAQAAENGPKIAFAPHGQPYAVWSIPSQPKGDITRANIRFAVGNSQDGFKRAETLNEVKNTARFPMIEFSPDGNLLVAWIDRRLDNPQPRQLYLMRLATDGSRNTQNYRAGEGLCECCKLGIAFAENGKTVYIVSREVDSDKKRNHVLRRSTDGGFTFGKPVLISDDGWQVPSCPHSGPSIGLDSRRYIHVSWFTLGRSEKEAGIYCSVSKDGGRSFAPRKLIHANNAPEILYNNLLVGDDDTVYFAWTDVDAKNQSQVYTRTLAPDGQTWGPIQRVSNARGNASRPVMALKQRQIHIAWTEIDGESSRIVIKSAEVAP